MPKATVMATRLWKPHPGGLAQGSKLSTSSKTCLSRSPMIHEFRKYVTLLPVSLLCKQVAPSLSEDDIDLQGNIGERIFMPSVSGWVTQGHSLPFHIQKGKRDSDNWDAQGQVGFFRLSFKVLKTVSSSSSHKMGLGLLLLSKTYRDLAIREKFRIQFL